MAEHFDAVIGGIELVSGDSEVNDPVEQYQRFVEQRKERQLDDDDAPHPHDEEYVRALEYGLAPSASGGMGVDRLLMILTGHETLREVAPFPVMRELHGSAEDPHAQTDAAGANNIPTDTATNAGNAVDAQSNLRDTSQTNRSPDTPSDVLDGAGVDSD